MIKTLKTKLIYWLAKDLLPIVDEKELMVFKNGKPFINGVELSTGEIIGLKAEADIIGKMRLWQIIVNDLNEKSQKRMYKDAIDTTDFLFGKTVLYVLDIQQKFIDKLKNKN